MGGTELGKFRAEQGYSIEVVAEGLKIAVSRLGEIEAGAMPSVEEMSSLFFSIGMDPDRFSGHVRTIKETERNFVEGLIRLGLTRSQAKREWTDVQRRRAKREAVTR